MSQVINFIKDKAEIDVVAILLLLLTIIMNYFRKFKRNLKQQHDNKSFIWLENRHVEKYIGRKAEVRKISKAIKKKKSVFIHGPAGIGKTTLAWKAICDIRESQLTRQYADILEHDFSKETGTKNALRNILNQIIADTQLLDPYIELPQCLKKNHYLIFLDSCEKSEKLVETLEILQDATIIITTRNQIQLGALSDARRHYTLRCQVRPLSLKNAISYLRFQYPVSWNCGRKGLDSKRKIVEIVGRLPLALKVIHDIVIRTNESPGDFLDFLEKEGIAALHSPCVEQDKCEKHSIDLLLAKSTGLHQATGSPILSLESKRLLGLAGVLSTCRSFNSTTMALFLSSKNDSGLNFPSDRKIQEALLELVDYHLFDCNKERTYFGTYHSLIYQYLQKHAIDFIGGLDNLYRGISFITFYYTEVLGKSSNLTPYFVDELARPLRDAVFRAQSEGNFTPERLTILAPATYALSELGFWEEAIVLCNTLLNFTYLNSDIIKEIRNIKVQCLTELENFPDAIKIMEELLEDSRSIVELHNMGIILLRMGNFHDAYKIFTEVAQTKSFNGDILGETEEKAAAAEALSQMGEHDNALRILGPACKVLEDTFGSNNIKTIDAQQEYGLALIRAGKYTEGYQMVSECIKLISVHRSQFDPKQLRLVAECARLLYKIENVSYLFEYVIKAASIRFGVDHSTTRMFRKIMNKCNKEL